MRTILIIQTTLLSLGLSAQPGDLYEFFGPCGLMLQQQVDLTNDGNPDLTISRSSEGTDDVPSSSGTCSIDVLCVNGTMLLNASGDPEQPSPVHLGRHGVIDSVFWTQRNPIHWYSGQIEVSQWGYGTSAQANERSSNLVQDQYFVASVEAADRRELVIFRIDLHPETNEVSVELIAHGMLGTEISW